MKFLNKEEKIILKTEPYFSLFSSTHIAQCQKALFELSNVFQGVLLAPIRANDLFIMLGSQNKLDSSFQLTD